MQIALYRHSSHYLLFLFQLSQFCPSDKAVLIAQKTCLLMAAAIDLELGRQEVTLSEQVGRCSVASFDLYPQNEHSLLCFFTFDFEALVVLLRRRYGKCKHGNLP